MAHLLGCYCLDLDRRPELEAMAHLLGWYCLDLDRRPELEAMAHLLGWYCLDVDRRPEPEARSAEPEPGYRPRERPMISFMISVVPP
jgi:hypothetical protein